MISFPNSANRKIGLFCARLIVQGVIASFDPQIGIDAALCFDVRGISSVEPVAGHQPEIKVPEYCTAQAAQQTLPHPRPV